MNSTKSTMTSMKVKDVTKLEHAADIYINLVSNKGIKNDKLLTLVGVKICKD